MHRGHLAAVVCFVPDAANDETIAQPHLGAWREPEKSFGRCDAEIIPLDPQLTGKWHIAHPELRLLRMVGGMADLGLVRLEVVDHQPDRVKHRDAALGLRVQILAHAILEHAEINPRVGARHADPFGKQPKPGRRVAAPAGADQGGHAWVIPARNVAFIDQLDQLALGQHHIGEIESGEFDLLRHRSLQMAQIDQAVEHPVIKRPVVFEFKRADRVGDVLQRIGDAVGVVIERVDAPGIAGPMVVCAANPVDGRIAHVHIGRGHVDTQAQHPAAIGKFTRAHSTKFFQVLAGGPIAVRTGPTRFGERAAIGPHPIGILMIDISQTSSDQCFGELVQSLKIIGGEVAMLGVAVGP